MATPVRIPVFFDFASTICFFTHRVLARVAPEIRQAGIELVWSPIDLVTVTGFQRGAAFDDPRRTNIRTLSEQLCIPVTAPSRWMDSRAALAAFVALADETARDRWREAIWRWVYEQGRSLDEPACLSEVSAVAGLPEPSVRRHDYVSLERRSLDAVRLGVAGVPTFLLDAYPLGIGIHDDRTMLAFLRRFAARKRPSP